MDFLKGNYMFLKFFIGSLIVVQSAGASNFLPSYDRACPTAAPRRAAPATSSSATYDGIIRDELGKAGNKVIGAVQNLQKRAERTGKDSKVALAALLSTGYGVGGISERAATKDEQDVILQAAATAFNGLGVLEVTGCLSQWESTDFKWRLKTAGPNAQTHHTVMRAFGLAALYHKAKEDSVSTIMQHVSQGFDGISFQSSIGIVSFLRNYADGHRWADYVEGFDRIHAALAGLEVKRQGGSYYNPLTPKIGQTRTTWPKVVFVSTYHGWAASYTYKAIKVGSNRNIVFGAPNYTHTSRVDNSTVHGWRVRPHGAIFPDLPNDGKDEAGVNVAIYDFVSPNFQDLNCEGGVSIHPHDRTPKQSVLSPANMEIPAEVLPSGELRKVYSFISYVASTNPIYTFHCVGPSITHRDTAWYPQNDKDVKDVSEVFLWMLIRSSLNKPHVERMIEFISTKG